MNGVEFKVGFSPDFLDEQGTLIFPDIGLSLFKGIPGLSYVFLQEHCQQYLPQHLADLDVLITMKPHISAGSVSGIHRLCGIGRCGVGYDNVDLKACTDHDIAVYITPSGVVRPMASSIVLLVLALSHNLIIKDQFMRAGRWVESTRQLGREPRDRIIGTIGLGNIASEAIQLLRHFDVKEFVAFDPYTSDARAEQLGVTKLLLDDLLAVSDYVLINCPLTNETRGLIGSREIALMKRTAFLINTARGPIVNESALICALKERKIAGAALDVFEEEPLANDSPLLALDNIILTSHSIGWTEELFRDLGRIDCQGALALMKGEVPANVVNRDVLDQPGFRRKLEQNARRHRLHTELNHKT